MRLAIAVPQQRGGGHEQRRQVAHLQPVEVPAQQFAGRQPLDGRHVQPQQQRAGHIHRPTQPAVPLHHRPFFREDQDEMQEQRRLQVARHHVRPEHDPVKGVELPREVERIQNERGQAEEVEVRSFGRGPAPQQHVQPNPQVDEGDETLSLVQGLVRGPEDQRRLHRHALADQRVIGLGPDAGAPQLALDPGGRLHRSAVDPRQQVAGLQTGARPGAQGIDPRRHQPAIALHEPHPVVGHGQLPLFLEIDPGKHHRRECHQRQDGGRGTDLNFLHHGPVRQTTPSRRTARLCPDGGRCRESLPLRLQLRCQRHCHNAAHKCLLSSRLHNYRWICRSRIRNLEFGCGLW